MADATDRRAFMQGQWDAAAKDEETETPEPTEEVEAKPDEEPEAPAEESSAADDDSAPAETPEAKAQRERDDKGRFAKAEGKEKAPKAAAPAAPAAPAKPAAAPPPKPEAAAPAAPAAPATKPPQSWTAAEREAWGKLPVEAQRAVLRREQEVTRVLQDNANLRKAHGEAQHFASQIAERLRPYEGLARANGMDAMSYADSVLQTAAALAMGTPQQKAGLFAQLLTSYGADLDMVNAALQDPRAVQFRPAQPAPQPRQQQPVDIESAVQKAIEARVAAAANAKADREWQEFQAGAHEFLDSPGIQEAMQDYLDAAHARGRNPSFEQAYDFALKMDPEIQAILKQRAEAAAVAAPSAIAPTVRARAAAATVRSRPASLASEEVDLTDRRAVIQRMAGRAGR